jgi:hypothetical protein
LQEKNILEFWNQFKNFLQKLLIYLFLSKLELKIKTFIFFFCHTIKHIKTTVQVAKNTVRVIKTTIRCNSEEVSLSNRDVARKWGWIFAAGRFDAGRERLFFTRR